MATAHNDWQIAEWCERDQRLRATLVVVQDDAAAAVKEIERCARDKRFVQIMLAPRSSEPLGRERYWPIYEAAQAFDLPLGIHSYGVGGHASTGGGWPSFYMEEHYATTMGGPAVMSSMVLEGVLERFQS
jgi:predicted TIM-barrel fold metal-dependent hydrolase